MMPGHVRQAGIQLYEEGKVHMGVPKKGQVLAQVADQELVFSLNDQVIFCACDFFQTKQFCAHLAAVEAFLNYDGMGAQLRSQLESSQTRSAVSAVSPSPGLEFLNKLPVLSPPSSVGLSLSVVGEEDWTGENIWWTLKLQRWPDARAYVVRDIKLLLKSIKTGRPYPIGKQYFEPLQLQQFDEASQEVLHFLWRLIPESEAFDSRYYLPELHRYLFLPPEIFEEGVTYLSALSDFSMNLGHQTYNSVQFRPLDASSDLFHFEVVADQHTLILRIKERSVRPMLTGTYLFYRACFYQVNSLQQALLAALAQLPLTDGLEKCLQFKLEDRLVLASHLRDFESLGPVLAPDNFKLRDVVPHFHLSIQEETGLRLQTTLVVDDYRIRQEAEVLSLPFALDYRQLEQLWQQLAVQGFHGEFEAQLVAAIPQRLPVFFSQILPALKALGQVTLSDDLAAYHQVATPQFSVHREGHWLEVDFDFSNIEEADVNQALAALASSADYFVTQAGQYVVFDEKTKQMAQTLQQWQAQPALSRQFRLPSWSAFQLTSHLSAFHQVHESQAFQQLVEDLRHPEAYPIQPPNLTVPLRDYQLVGVRWLTMLAAYGFGGILADDMGLGKTLQTIAFLKNHLTSAMRVLILSPSSLIYNWKMEFQRFAPEMDVAVVYGAKPMRTALIDAGHQVLITSYTAFRQDIEHYRSRAYDVLILDEAQLMKNAQTKLAQQLRQFEVKHCFALSGTPIENRLLDIWSLFEIIMPGFLPAQRAFGRLTAEEVARYIKPFVLRRRKTEVLPELPEVTEINQMNDLVPAQKALYLAQLRQMTHRLANQSDEEINRHRMEILAGITRLRQICDTPQLFLEDYQGGSGKLESLVHLLRHLKAKGHRPLIFSQFRAMLDLIEQETQQMGLQTFKLTGETASQARQAMATAFNEGQGDAFLISLKAGGVGLNLTGADTVILVDLWWNPAVEAQALGRANRLGQTQPVQFYRLITRGTIEEKILALQEKKRDLVQTVLDDGNTQSGMTVADIREILGLVAPR